MTQRELYERLLANSFKAAQAGCLSNLLAPLLCDRADPAAAEPDSVTLQPTGREIPNNEVWFEQVGPYQPQPTPPPARDGGA